MSATSLRMSGIRRNEHDHGFWSGRPGKGPHGTANTRSARCSLSRYPASTHSPDRAHSCCRQRRSSLYRLGGPAAGAAVQYVFHSAQRSRSPRAPSPSHRDKHVRTNSKKLAAKIGMGVVEHRTDVIHRCTAGPLVGQPAPPPIEHLQEIAAVVHQRHRQPTKSHRRYVVQRLPSSLSDSFLRSTHCVGTA